MKTFDTARLQMTAFDPETEEKITITLGGLKAEAEVATVLGVRDALNDLVKDPISLTVAVESYIIG